MARLSVVGPYEFTEFRVLDAGLREHASGTGSLLVDLPVGIYRVQARVPGAFDQQFVSVLSDGLTQAQVTSSELEFDSPVPVPRARTGNFAHQIAAENESRNDRVRRDEPQSAELFVFLRSDGVSRSETPMLRIEAGDGSIVARLSDSGVTDLDQGYAALSVALPAGVYAVVHESPGLGNRAQAVLVETGWQTQMFIPWDNDAVDPANAHISMLRIGIGFDSRLASQYEDVEAALSGLARNRVVLASSEEWFFQTPPDYNPMLSLIATYAHMLHRGRATDQIKKVTLELLRLLPHSPDAGLLYRLAWGSSDQGESYETPPLEIPTVFESPPMFAAGIERLRDWTVEEVATVPKSSWLAQVLATQTSGSVYTRWDVDLDPGQRFQVLLHEATSGGVADATGLAREMGRPRSAVETDLAHAFAEAGLINEGIELFESALRIRQRVLGTEDPLTLTSQSDLAFAYMSAGRHDEAIPLFEAALRDRERVLGQYDPDTLSSQSNLAGAYASSDRLEEAIPLFQASLRGRERTLGSDHSDTLSSRINVAAAYSAAGRSDLAVPHFEAALRDAERVLGPNHPVTQAVRANLMQAVHR